MKDTFNGLCSYLVVGNIQITDLAKLSPSVWSGKVLDTPSRLKLLSETKRLRSSNMFKDFHIQRNLTYRHRRCKTKMGLLKLYKHNKKKRSKSIPLINFLQQLYRQVKQYVFKKLTIF